MEVLASTWLQLSPISIHTSASAPVGRLSKLDMLQFDWYIQISRKAPESSKTLPDRFSVGFSGWSRDYSLRDKNSHMTIT